MNSNIELLDSSRIFLTNEYDYICYFLSLFILSIFWIQISKPKTLNLYLYIIHAIFGALFLYFTKNFQSDSERFFMLGSVDICPLILDSKIASNSGLTYCISGISKLVVVNYGFSTGIFSFLGFLGINIFFNFLKRLAENTKQKLQIFYFFSIPSISFWTTGVGKDSLMILFYGLIFKFLSTSFLKEKKYTKQGKLLNFLYLATGLLGSYLTRTYTLYIIAISLLFSKAKEILNLIINLRSKKSQLILIPTIVILLVFANSLIFDILNNASLNPSSDNFNLISQRAALSQASAIESGGAYIGQTGIMKMLFIIGGPFSFQNPQYILESIVGLVFFIIVFLIFKNINILIKSLLRFNSLVIFLVTLTSLDLVKLYLFSFNVGIISRQRILPLILAYVTYYIIKPSKFRKKINS